MGVEGGGGEGRRAGRAGKHRDGAPRGDATARHRHYLVRPRPVR